MELKGKKVIPLGKSWRELRTGVRLEESRKGVRRKWKVVTVYPRDFKGLVEKS